MRKNKIEMFYESIRFHIHNTCSFRGSRRCESTYTRLVELAVLFDVVIPLERLT